LCPPWRLCVCSDVGVSSVSLVASHAVQIVELWRYPVKSLQGERLDSVAVTADGLTGDRRFAIYDLQSGFGLTARRVPELLFASARLRADGAAEITLPDGSVAEGDAGLSEWLGRPVTLRSATTEAARRYENVVDFEHETTSDWAPFEGAEGVPDLSLLEP